MPSADRLREWRELYDPDMGHLINPHSGHPFPTQILKPQELNNSELLVRLGFIPTHDLPTDDPEVRDHAIQERH
jgi:hypothetical protein